MKAIYFENVSATKLKDFRSALTSLKEVQEALGIFAPLVPTLTSKRLRQLLTTSDVVGGLFPSKLSESIAVLEKMVVWRTGGSGEDIPEP